MQILDLQSVQGVDVANAGSGYTVAPSVTFSTTDGTGTGAAQPQLLVSDSWYCDINKCWWRIY